MNRLLHIVVLMLLVGMGNSSHAQEDSTDILSIDLESIHYMAPPSAMQYMAMIRHTQAKYDSTLSKNGESDPNNLSVAQAALTLGACYSQLTYLVSYDQPNITDHLDRLLFLDGILNLQAFNESFKKRMQQNAENKDSLLIIIMDAGYVLEQRFFEEDDKVVGAYIRTGEFIESYYIMTALATTDSQNKALDSRVIETKYVVENTVNYLKQYPGEPNIQALINAFEDLYEFMKDVDVVYAFGKPSTDTKNKTTLINSETEVEVPAGFINEVFKKLTEIRASFLPQ